jgi:tRNA nucleotidyltransferase/poly(A) polymerase
MAKPATESTALWVVRRLRQAGFQALFAGGCVRDMLLGRKSSDYDVATEATPQQVRKLFSHVLLVGAKFGVAMVIHRGRKVEVTTFRSDLSYSDGRRPDGVRFSSPKEDALRRDFTINGMFYDPLAGKVLDHVGGQRDLRHGVIRTIGPAERRFAEDYLRMLRAVRFAVRLNFRIDRATAAAIRKHAPHIRSISGERIYDELTRMLSIASAGDALCRLADLGLAQAILPGLFAGAATWPAALARVEAVAARQDVLLTLSALMAGLGDEEIRRAVRGWGAGNDVRDGLCWIARHLKDWRRAAEMPLAEFKRLLARRHFEHLRRLWAVHERRETGRLTQARRIRRRAAGIPKNRIAPPPLVTGDDLKRLGLPEGPLLGQILGELYDAQLNETLTSRRAALKAAREMIRQAGGANPRSV